MILQWALLRLAGVTMGTRSGNIDPALIPYHDGKGAGLTADEVLDVLNKESGMLGVSGSFKRPCEISRLEAVKGNDRAELALDSFCGQNS